MRNTMASILFWLTGSLCLGVTRCQFPGQWIDCRDPRAFACGDGGGCIGEWFLCDTVRNCVTSADENYCELTGSCPKPLRCKYTLGGPCLQVEDICSGNVECWDGSDEFGCGPTCRADQFLCSLNGKCHDYTKLCDGIVDCPGLDEIFCDRFCEVEELQISPGPDGLVFRHDGQQYPAGFYSCHWLLTSNVTSYIFIAVVDLRIPLYGKLRLSIGTGQDTQAVDSVILDTDSSALPMTRVYIGSVASQACWIRIRSNRLVTIPDQWFGNLIEPLITLRIYQRDQRVCPGEFISCPLGSIVPVCISPSALCNGVFDCPDYWDESECELTQADTCGPQRIGLDITETRSVWARSDSVWRAYDAINCLWFVSAPPSGRIEIVVNKFRALRGRLAVGIAGDNQTVDLTSTFLTVTSDRLNVLTAYSPVAGVPLWMSLSMTSSEPSTSLPVSHLQLTVRAYVEIECGLYEFACLNAQRCLPLSQRCDGIPQCPSFSDERGCYGCETSMFTCDGHRCLADEYLCDGFSQCNDMTDEYLCGRCGVTPAVDLSDGRPKTIAYNPADRPGDCLLLITAAQGHRVSLRLRHIPQVTLQPTRLELAIGDGVDPSDPSTLLHTITFSYPPPVSYREAVTSSGTRMWVRQKYSDPVGLDVAYAFGASETIVMEAEQTNQTGCSSNEYACATGTCISQSFVCDGFVDCADYGDETGCYSCGQDEYHCLSGNSCLPLTDICDQQSTSFCPDESDELVCGPCGRTTIDLSRLNAGSSRPYVLNAPFFTLPYQVTCTWSVVAPPGSRVLARINGIGPGELSFGRVTSTIGPVLRRASAGSLASVASRDRHMWIKFDASYSHDEEQTGVFSLNLEARETVSCGDGQAACGSPDLLCLHETVTEYQRLFICGDDICGERNIYLEESTLYTLSSPNYPDVYPNNVNCTWQVRTVRAGNGRQAGLVVAILDFRTETSFDPVTVEGPGLVLGDLASDPPGSRLTLSGTTRLTTVASLGGEVSVTFTSDYAFTLRGFRMTFEALQSVTEWECFGQLDLACENTTVCVSKEAVCNGFKDCAYGYDESQCFSGISCPEFFQCSGSKECIFWSKVCDGHDDCLLNDDEIKCDVNRCPDECQCYYKEEALYVSCRSGWAKDTLENMAATTDVLELSGGNFTTLEPGLFKRFLKLQALYLTGNGIQHIPLLAFEGLSSLLWLNISQNDLTVLGSDSFKELKQLQGIVISDVPLEVIEDGAFDGLHDLRTLVLIRGKHAHGLDGPIEIRPEALRDLTKLQTLYLDDHRLCCEFNKLESFDPANCFTTEQQSPLFNCGSLMQNTFLRVSMWILGLSALIGNMGVVGWRCWSSSVADLGQTTRYVHNFLVLNLAMSDFLMGIYMIIIAVADVRFGEGYYKHASTWRLGIFCKMAGVISVLSCEASVFFITLLSVDRFFCIVFPHGVVRLVKGSARLAAVAIWMAAFVLSSLPTILVDSDSDVYGLSDVCIGLPLITKPASYKLQEGNIGNPLGSQSLTIPVPQDRRPAWVYSIVIFLGVNLLCFLAIAVCYAAIFVKFRASYRRVKGARIRGSDVLNRPGGEEMAMALRMAVIVGTDFLCWMPVIIMGILSQSGAVTIEPHIYAWTVVFILPINSSINPYLYTVFSVVSARRSQGNTSAGNTNAVEPRGKRSKPYTETHTSSCDCNHPCDSCDTHL